MAERLKGFRYLEGTIRVSVIVQGAPYAQGRLVLCAFPHGPTAERPIVDHVSFNNMRILPHVLIDPSKSATYVLDLPIIGPDGMMRLYHTRRSWWLGLIVYDPLGSGTSAQPQINLETRATLIEPKLRGKIVPRAFIYGLETEALDTRSIIKGVVRGLRYATGFPSLSTYATSFSNLSAQAAAALESIGFSRPNVLERNPLIVQTGDVMTQVDGNNVSYVLGRSQQMPSAINPNLMNGDVSEMELSTLLKKAILVSKHVVQVTTPPNNEIGSFWVNPATTHTNPTNNPSVATVLTDACCAWNGSVTYSFEFVCSVFHRATFLISYTPDVFQPSYEEALASTENINVTVSGNTHVKWTIPWRQAAATHTSDLSNGKIWIFLVDSVITNGSDDGIMLDVLADFSECHFHFPTVAPLPDNQYAISAYSSDWIESSDFTLSGDSRTLNGTIAGGDTVRSVKDLVARASLIDHDTSSEFIVYKAGILRAGFRSWFDIVAPWYYGWRGSFRYHGVVRSDKENAFAGRYITAFEPLSSYVDNKAEMNLTDHHNAVQTFNPAVINGFDVIVPYTAFSKNFSSGQIIGDPSPGLYVHKAGSDDELLVYRAAGDDFVAGFFLGVPRMVTS
nr:MAG: structural protein [Picornaviridae sp.]